jgi:hypothetical protein
MRTENGCRSTTPIGNHGIVTVGEDTCGGRRDGFNSCSSLACHRSRAPQPYRPSLATLASGHSPESSLEPPDLWHAGRAKMTHCRDVHVRRIGAVEDWGRKSFCRQFKRESATKFPIFVLDVSSPGFRRQLRRVRRLLLLARHVPRLPRFRLGLRLRLQLLVRLTTLRRCGGCHVSLFQFYLSGAGERDTAQSTQRNGPLQHVPNTEAEAALLKTTTSRTLCGMFSLKSAATTIALERAAEVWT